MTTAILSRYVATTLVMTLIIAATTPVLGGVSEKFTGSEDIKKYHLNEKDNVNELTGLEARYKGKKGRSPSKGLLCWRQGEPYNLNSGVSGLMRNTIYSDALTNSCEVY